MTLEIGQRVQYKMRLWAPDDLDAEQGAFEGTVISMGKDEYDDFYVRVSFDNGDTRELIASDLEDLAEEQQHDANR